LTNKAVVRLIGIFLITLGFSCLVTSLNVAQNVAVGYYSMARSFPMSIASPQEKISKALKEESTKAKPGEKIPVVVVLTGDTGAMAIAQQEIVLPSLQAVGFEMTMSITDVDNAVAGTIPADKVDDVAANPYVEKVLYDGKFFRITSDLPTVKLLKDSIPMIRAQEVWAEGYTGQGVVVIIIDSGVQNYHPWLMRNGKSLVIDEKVIVPNAHDYTHWHGTHCAGIIASQDLTYKGVAPGIDGFIDIVAFDWQGSARLSWILEALDYAYKKAKELKAQGKAVVSTNSWGAPPYDSDELNEVRKAALKLTEVCPVVFATGNSGPGSGTISCPGDADDGQNEVITVGAVDKNGNVAIFSSRGPDTWGVEHNEPDVSAPGVNVISSVPGGSRSASGTSMATPHVAGVVALMLSKNPTLTNRQCLEVLMNMAVDKGRAGFDYDYGAGIVDAKKAVDAISQASPIATMVPSDVVNIIAAILLLAGAVLIINPNLMVRGG